MQPAGRPAVSLAGGRTTGGKKTIGCVTRPYVRGGHQAVCVHCMIEIDGDDDGDDRRGAR